MSRISVKDYMHKVEAVYKAAAVKVCEDAEKLRKLKKEQEDVNHSQLLTPQGKTQRRAELQKQIDAVNQHVAELRADANKRAKAIKDDMEDTFFGFYGVNPADVDTQTMALVNAGVVSDRELLAMAKKANPTMKRILAKKLTESDNKDAATMGRAMLIRGNPHIDAVNAIMGVGEYAVGGGVSGIDGAQTFIDRWDELTRETYNAAPQVARVFRSAAPGAVLFDTPDNPIADDE